MFSAEKWYEKNMGKWVTVHCQHDQTRRVKSVSNVSFKFGCWNDSRRTKKSVSHYRSSDNTAGLVRKQHISLDLSPLFSIVTKGGHFTTHRTCQTFICFHQEKMWWSTCWRIEFNTIPSTNTFLWLTSIWIDETTWMSWCDWGGRGRCSRKGGVEVLTPLELFYKGSQSPPVLSWSVLVRLEALGGRERGGGPN